MLDSVMMLMMLMMLMVLLMLQMMFFALVVFPFVGSIIISKSLTYKIPQKRANMTKRIKNFIYRFIEMSGSLPYL